MIPASPFTVSLPVVGESLPARVWERVPTRGSGGPTVVLIHGFRGDHHGMDLIASRLAGRARTLVPDLPGFGETPALTGHPHDLAAFVSFVRSLLAQVPGPTVLVGHSFGSIVVAHAAAEMLAGGAQETPTALGLLNPISTPALEGPQKIPTLAARAYYALGSALPEPVGQGILTSRAIVRVMSEVMAKTRDPELRRYIHDQHRRYFSSFADRRSLLEAFDVSISHTVAEVAPRLTLPTAILAGGRDDLATVAAQRALAGAIPGTPVHPGARLDVVDGVGHLTHYESPDAAADLIARLAGDVSRPPSGQQGSA